MKIYVGNFSSDVTEEDLKSAFEAFGQVADVKLIKDKFSGESRGFAFIEMPSKKEAEEAIDGVKELKGKMVSVNEARPRPDHGGRPRSGFKGGRGRDSRPRRY